MAGERHLDSDARRRPPARPGRWLVRGADRVRGREEHRPARRGEVFGPVTAVIPFDGDDEAVLIANDSNYDLGAPFGGMKDSGIGRELGPEGLNNYLEYKSIYASAAHLQG